MKNSIYILLLFLVSNTGFSQDSTSLNMTLLAQYDVDSLPSAGIFSYNDVWGYVDCEGNEYAILGSSGSVHFFDVTNPDTLIELGNFPGGNVTTWRDMKTYKNHAYTVCDGCSEGMMIFDMSFVPDSVVKVTQTDEDFKRCHNLFVDESVGRMYAVGTDSLINGVIIYDVETTPGEPIKIAETILPGGYVHDCYIRDNIGYMNHGNAGLFVYDFTDPTTPILLGTMTEYPQSGYNHSCWLSDDGNTLIMCDETHNRGVKSVDVSDLGDIHVQQIFRSKLLAPNDTASIAHNPLIRGNLAFVSYYHDGLAVFDISNPENVTKVAFFDTHLTNQNYQSFIGNWGVYPFLPSGTILASDMTRGLHTFSLQNIDLQPITPTLFPEATISLAGEQKICEDGILEIEALSVAENFEWFLDDSLITVGVDSLGVNVEGDYHFVASNSFCKINSDTANLSLILFPNVEITATPNLQFCEGDSVTLSVPAGADFYEWSHFDFAFATDTNSVTVFEAGEYYLKAANENCFDNSDPIFVETIPYPIAETFASNEGFCPGDSVVILAWEDVSSYQWLLNGDTIPTGNTQIIVAMESGDYSVIVNNESCETVSENIFVEAYQPQTPEISNDDNFLTTSFALSYQWFLNGEAIEDATEQIFEIPETGIYHVEIEDLNGCFAASESMEIIFSNSNDVDFGNEFLIFPNPTSDHISIKLKNTASNISNNFDIQLFNAQGKLLISQKHSFGNGGILEISLNDFVNGIYFLNLRNEKGGIVRKVIKE